MNQSLHDIAAKFGLPHNEETVDFRSLVYAFWENKNLIFAITFSIMFLAALYTFNKPSLYEANALVLIESKNNNGLSGLSQTLSLGVPETNSTSTQIALIRSRVILAPVIHQLGLDISPENLADQLHIEELGDGTANQTGILQISFSDTDPDRVVNVLNAIVKVTQAKDAERKSLETAHTLSFLNQQLPLAKAALEEAETAYNKYRAHSGKIDIKLETQQLLIQLNAIEKQITDATLLRTNSLQNYTAKNSFMLGLDEKIKELKKLKRGLNDQIKTLPAADQVAVSLMRDAKVKNDIYLMLLRKIQETQVIKAGTLSDVRILAPAVRPALPLPKHGAIVLLASLVLGLMLSCITVIGRKAFMRRVSDPRWIEQHLNLINLAIIPFSKQQIKNIHSYKTKQSTSMALLAEKFPRDLSIEALRSLRTSFQLLSMEASNNIITIMGISPGIGKSFVSVNFSYLLSEAKKRVLLIDGDIRKGHLHDYFNGQRTPGLSEVLAGSTNIEDVLQTHTGSLSFLPCGNYPLNPAELLIDARFKQLMATLSQQFDLVVIDTAPILAVTDCTLIGAVAGLNFLVLGADKHQPEEITLAVKRLDNAKIKIAGTIINNLKPETTVNGNYRYNYYSEYGNVEPLPTSVNLQ